MQPFDHDALSQGGTDLILAGVRVYAEQLRCSPLIGIAIVFGRAASEPAREGSQARREQIGRGGADVRIRDIGAHQATSRAVEYAKPATRGSMNVSPRFTAK